MKTIQLLLLLVSLSSVSFGQTEVPKKEFVLDLSTTSLTIGKSASKEIVLNVVASKSYAKSKAVYGTSSGLPQGITVSIQPSAENQHQAIATIATTNDVAPGNYMLILNATLQNKKKGATLKITVSDEKQSGTASKE